MKSNQQYAIIGIVVVALVGAYLVFSRSGGGAGAPPSDAQAQLQSIQQEATAKGGGEAPMPADVVTPGGSKLKTGQRR